MLSENASAGLVYEVVVNDEGQYSIWPADKAIPLGWHLAGKRGVRESCLEYINEVWLDMRPLSLRKHMAATPHTAGGVATLAAIEEAEASR
ncbi:MbtH protein [Janthinobacterium sp. CG_23.3]|uniref:MbtH family protein n=1 Tax=Janthinobacterium sp. CG_23.3 TaxID=3349634 RepID=UPI0038D45BE1